MLGVLIVLCASFLKNFLFLVISYLVPLLIISSCTLYQFYGLVETIWLSKAVLICVRKSLIPSFLAFWFCFKHNHESLLQTHFGFAKHRSRQTGCQLCKQKSWLILVVSCNLVHNLKSARPDEQNFAMYHQSINEWICVRFFWGEQSLVMSFKSVTLREQDVNYEEIDGRWGIRGW